LYITLIYTRRRATQSGAAHDERTSMHRLSEIVCLAVFAAIVIAGGIYLAAAVRFYQGAPI